MAFIIKRFRRTARRRSAELTTSAVQGCSGRSAGHATKAADHVPGWPITQSAQPITHCPGTTKLEILCETVGGQDSGNHVLGAYRADSGGRCTHDRQGGQRGQSIHLRLFGKYTTGENDGTIGGVEPLPLVAEVGGMFRHGIVEVVF
jgi:hypothetical protein